MNLKAKCRTLFYVLVSAALIAGILTGCGAKSMEPAEEESTEADGLVTLSAEEADGISEEMSMEETVEETEQSSETEEDLNAEFLNAFSIIADHSYINHCNVVYDDETKNNLTFALESSIVSYFSVWAYCAKKFDWPDSSIRYVSDAEYYDDEKQEYVKAPDPLNRFGKAEYRRYDGDKIDWILINVFNVKPDHSYDSNQHKADKRYDRFDCYYRDGYYYCLDVSDGIIAYYDLVHLNLKMDAKTKNSSGEYQLSLSGYEPNEGKKVSTYSVVAQLNQVDGQKVWKLISVQEKPTAFWQESLETIDFMDLFSEIASSRDSIIITTDYGPDSKDKLTYALNYVDNIWGSVWRHCSRRFHWPESSFQGYCDSYDSSSDGTIPKKPDPLNQFAKYYAYNRFDGDKVDWILKNILNVKPDHSYNSNKVHLGDDLDYGFSCYYHDGYYYYSDGDGGGASPRPKLDFKTKKSNGDYVFKLSEYDLEDDSKLVSTYIVTAQLNQVDGYKVWKLISIQQTITK